MINSRIGRNTVQTNRGPIHVNRRMIMETGNIPEGLQFIRDTYTFEVKKKENVMTEGVNGREEPVMRVTGLIQMGDTENQNGRTYPTSSVLAPAVRSIQEDIQARAVLGEFDHPADARLHLDRVSHLMTNVWMDGRKMYGEAEVLHRVPLGNALRGLFEHKCRVGISSRGVGDMEMHESDGRQTYVVLPGYSFVTWDAVAEPSVQGAILNIQESVQKFVRTESQKAKRPAQRGVFSESAYNRLVMGEINKLFNLK